ncbi:MAG: oligosaccharide repeat unit polymerase [Acidobacteria bacterium]|nr:oligosaccharide repeat unit polymerase [Acidobacteriota bacterium]
MGFLFGTASLAFALWRAGKDCDSLHPVRVFGATWCLCIGLASLKLTTAISDWHPAMWAYVLTALICFTGGFWVVTHYLNKNLARPVGASKPELPDSELLAPRRALVIAFICLAIGLAALSYEYYLIGEVPIFAEDIDAARTKFFATAGQWSHPEFDTLFNKFIGVTTILCKYAAYLCLILLIQRGRKSLLQKCLALVIVLSGSFSLVSQGGRGFIFELVFFAGAFTHYLRQRWRFKHLALAAFGLFVLLSFLGYIRHGADRSFAAYAQIEGLSNLPQGRLWDSVTLGYHSLTGPLEIFSRFTEDLPAVRPPSSGFLFYSLHRFVPRTGIQEFVYNLYQGTITATFLGEFYGDFGVLGVIFGPFFLGMIYGYVYYRALRYKSLYWVCILVIFLGMLVYFYHINFFSQQITWILDLIGMGGLIQVCKVGGKQSIFSFLRRGAMAGPQPSLARAAFHR